MAECIREPCSSENAPRLTPAAWNPTLESMEVSLTQDQEAFICQAIESGRFHRKEEAVLEALSLWEAKSLALAAKQEMWSDPENLKGIFRYVEEGLFPWED